MAYKFLWGIFVAATCFLFIYTRTYAAAPPSSPTWWSGTCDSNNLAGEKADGGSYDGIITCAPGPDYGGSQRKVWFLDSSGHDVGSVQEIEFECVELSMRYLWLIYGVPPYSANGSQVVENFDTSTYPHFTKVYNNQGQAPQPGDIISYGTAGNPNDPNNAGHTAVVISNSVNSSTGTGSITVLQEDSGQYYTQSETVSSWAVQPLSGDTSLSVEGWLHYNGVPANIKVTSGISASSSATLGESFTASYTVTNNGNSNFYLTELSLWGKDPNGNTFKIYGDNDGGGNIYVGANSTRTLNASIPDFASDCANCVNGNYSIIAEYQDINNGSYYQIGTNGGTNPITVSVSGSINELRTGSTTLYNNNGTLETFMTGNGGDILANTQNSGIYSGWVHILPGSSIAGKMSVIENASGELQLFARGTNGYIYTSNQTSPSQNSWSPLSNLGTTAFAGNPVVARQANGELDVFVRGTDDNLYHDYQDSNGNWSGWQSLISGTYIPSDPSLMLLNSGELAVFVRGSSGGIYNAWEQTAGDETSWTSSWSQLGSNAFAGDPVSIFQSNGDVDVFARGTDNTLYHDYQNSSGWSGWVQVVDATAMQGNPTAALLNSGALALFMRNSNGNMLNAWEQTAGDETSWTSSWTNLGSTSFTFSGDPVAFVRSNGETDVYALGGDYVLYYDTQNNSGAWSDWIPTCVETGNSTAAYNQNGVLDAFKVVSNGQLWVNTQNNGAYQSWSSIGSNNVAGAVSVIQNKSGGLEVFARGKDGYIYNMWQATPGNDSTWNSWTSTGATQFAGNPIAVKQSNGYLDVFARGTDNDLYHDYQDSNGNWSGWTPVISGSSISGDPSVVQISSGSLAVFVLGSGGGIYNAWEQTAGSETSWTTSWNQLGTNTFAGEPVSVRQASGVVDIFARGTDSNLYHDYQNSSGWSGWQSLISGTNIPGNPYVLLLNSGEPAVFVRGDSGGIYNAWEQTAGDETSWTTSWNQLGSTSFTFSSDPVVISELNGEGVDIYAIGTDGNLYHDYQTSSGWSDWNSI